MSAAERVHVDDLRRFLEERQAAPERPQEPPPSEFRGHRRQVDHNRNYLKRRRRARARARRDRPEPEPAVIPAPLYGTVPGYLLEIEQLAGAALGPRAGVGVVEWLERQVERWVAVRSNARILVRVCVQEGRMDDVGGGHHAR